MGVRFICYVLFGALVSVSCTRAESPAAGPAETETRPAIQRTLIMMGPALPLSLASQPLGGTGSGVLDEDIYKLMSTHQ